MGGPSPRERAMWDDKFPRTRLSCSLLLRIQRRGLNRDSDRWRWLKVGRDSLEISTIFWIWFSTLSPESGTQYGAFVGVVGGDWLPFCNVLKLTFVRSPFRLCWKWSKTENIWVSIMVPYKPQSCSPTSAASTSHIWTCTSQGLQISLVSLFCFWAQATSETLNQTL